MSRLLGTTRLLTLTGTGGCGKTRLAYESASDLLDEHPEQHLDGAWAVEFAPLADASLVSQTVAAALGLREEPGRPILDTLVDHLRSKKCLLVLDNCEHLLDPCARLADALLHACPGVQILATSREALGIAGETSYRVPSLALPDLQALPPLGELAACESVRLFVERARAAQPSFDLTEQEAAAIAQICWRLDGMPLAIELAAARVRGLTVQGIWRRLDDRLRLLTGGSRTALRRQQTLRATIDWSYDLLSEPERCLFRRLAVFSGGWSPEAAEEVCVGEASQASIEQDDVLALLLRLVDRSLVVADTDMGQERYRFPETIRQYAGEKLLDSGDMARVRDRHRDWYQGLVERAEPELVGPDSLAWLDRLEREHDNLRAALSWCLERDVAAGLEIVGRMREYFYLRSYANEGRSWATEVLARSSGESVARVRALNTAAISARIQGAGVASRRLFEESLGLARQLEDRSGLGYAALQLAMALAFEGEGDAAVPLAEEAILIGRELGETWMVVFALRVLGNLMTSRGELDEARQLLEESLTLARVAGHRLSIAFGIMDLGRVWLVGGELFRARALIEESLGLFEEADYGAGLVLARLCRAYVAIAEGDAQCAKALLIENVEEARQTELRTAAWGMSLRLAGLLAVDARAFARGVRLFGAYETARQRFVVDFDASHREMFLATLSKARSALGEEAFARAFAEGQTMTLEEAVEHALRDEE